MDQSYGKLQWKSLQKSWSKQGPLSIRSEAGDANPVLVQDSFTNSPLRGALRVSTTQTRRQSRINLNRSKVFSESMGSPLRHKSPHNGLFTVKNSIDTDLSSFTIQQNSAISEEIRKLGQIQKFKKGTKIERAMMEQNCSDMLRKTNKEIKNTSYKLSSVVSDGEYHLKVFPNYPEELEIIEDTAMYCKIQCNDLLSPAKITFHNYQRSDFSVYCSLKTPTPEKGNCDFSFKNPKKVYVHAEGKHKTFPVEFIYLCFYSYRGTSVQFTVTFPEDEEDISPTGKQDLASNPGEAPHRS